MKPFPWKCHSCGKQAVRPLIVELYATEVEHDGRAYEVSVPHLEVLECEHCQARRLPEDSSDKLTDALRAQAGLLMPAQIRQERERLGYTQKRLASLLRVAEATLSRWETGGQVQQRAMDLLLRIFFTVPEVQRWLVGGEKPAIPSPVANVHEGTSPASIPPQ